MSISLTDAVIKFLNNHNQCSNFCKSVNITEDNLESFLYEKIMPNNLEIFFDKNVILNYSLNDWSELSTLWKQYLPSVLQARETNHIDTLVAMSLDDTLPNILKNIANSQLKQIDNNPTIVNPMIVGSLFKQMALKADKRDKIKESRNPKDICENCEHCNLRREECDLDVWWDLSKVDITKKYCDRFSIKTKITITNN